MENCIYCKENDLERCENCDAQGCPECEPGWNQDSEGNWLCPECWEALKDIMREEYQDYLREQEAEETEFN